MAAFHRKKQIAFMKTCRRKRSWSFMKKAVTSHFATMKKKNGFQKYKLSFLINACIPGIFPYTILLMNYQKSASLQSRSRKEMHPNYSSTATTHLRLLNTGFWRTACPTNACLFLI